MTRPPPEWFVLAEEATRPTMEHLRSAIEARSLPLQVKFAPTLAHWFVLDSLYLASDANRAGMHANALALTRQCIEAFSVIELGICGHADAEAMLHRWWDDEITAGQLRKWLSEQVWPQYGSGLWHEPWADFMANLAAAVQPYAHYTSKLSQWQLRFLGGSPGKMDDHLIEIRPRAYDAQKATRISLYHGILTYALARMALAADSSAGNGFRAMISRLGKALGKSAYLDGHQTDWPHQFWAMTWSGETGSPILE
jgi:hypothetical protein